MKQANLSFADLTDANLIRANLTGAIVINTKLNGARLEDAILIEGIVCKEGAVGLCKKSVALVLYVLLCRK